MNKLKYYILGVLCLANINPAIAQTPKEVVQKFGEYLNDWCKMGNETYRKKIEALCEGPKKCRVEDKIHTEYQLAKGLRNYETFVLDSYLNMFEHEMDEGMRYKMSDIEICEQDEMSEGQKLTFLTATIDISGPVNRQVKDLFLVRDDKISGIYSYDSQLGFSHLNGSLIKELEFGRYKWTSGFHNGYAPVANEVGKCGLVDVKGNIIIPCIWNAIHYTGGDFAIGYNYKDNEDRAIYDLRYNGKETPLKGWINDYFIGRNKISTFIDGFALVKSGDKFGYLKENDPNYNVDFIYDKASCFSEGYACVTQNGKQYVIDKQFKPLSSINTNAFYVVGGPKEGLLCVMDLYTGKWGYMNLDGWVEIPCVFDEVEAFSNGIAKVKQFDSLSRYENFPSWHTALITKADYELHKERKKRNQNYWPKFEFLQALGDFEDGYIEILASINGELKGSLIGKNKIPLPGFNWEYDKVRSINDGLALCYKDNKCGYLNKRCLL